ncbi:MAG: hypothetical protein FWC67_00360 [Defluviitaleaceae bacterium]|nr:hypothetical protein [Defluviitaleaceae bacterium]
MPFKRLSEEHFYVMALDINLGMKANKMLAQGNVSSVNLNIQSIVDFALMHKASYIVAAHNHPGGVVTPSAEDHETTQTIRWALQVVNIALLDHIIVAGDEHHSMSKNRVYGLTGIPDNSKPKTSKKK